MPVKKTATKKTATKTVKKTTTKHVSPAKVVEEKKPTVIVETKKTDRCECVDCNCNCGSCSTCCCVSKIIVLILIIANFIIVLCTFFKKHPRDLTVLSLGGVENEEKVVKDLYEDEDYIKIQKDQIESSLSQFGIE